MSLKKELHPRNAHNNRYDFNALIEISPALKTVVSLNKHGDVSIDFSNPKAVKLLNKALLHLFYKIGYWDIPNGYLCPPIPGRADYIHYIADLLANYNYGAIPRGRKVLGVDIGVGANCIYPILGYQLFGWDFIGTDVDAVALKNAQKIIDNNENLHGAFTLLKQNNSGNLLKGIITAEKKFDFTICNPPFHASETEAKAASLRKVSNLKNKRIKLPILNFGGNPLELWCDGGEVGFISKLANESVAYAQQCFWFTSLVSKQTNIPIITKILKQLKATEIKVIEMAQGQKTSRLIAWTYLTPTQQKNWADTKWK